MIQNAAILSATGGRKENQDYAGYYEHLSRGCYLVADGLGGHGGGALASRVVGESIISAFKNSPGANREFMENYLDSACRQLKQQVARHSRPIEPKTTLVVLLVDSERAFWAHIGDSRLYMFRNKRLFFQTADHSVPWQLANSGEISFDAIRQHEDRNRLLRVFGTVNIGRVEYAAGVATLVAGDTFLLCTDGFWEYVYEYEMEGELALSGNPGSYLNSLHHKLASRAPSDSDNYTALAVTVS